MASETPTGGGDRPLRASNAADDGNGQRPPEPDFVLHSSKPAHPAKKGPGLVTLVLIAVGIVLGIAIVGLLWPAANDETTDQPAGVALPQDVGPGDGRSSASTAQSPEPSAPVGSSSAGAPESLLPSDEAGEEVVTREVDEVIIEEPSAGSLRPAAPADNAAQYGNEPSETAAPAATAADINGEQDGAPLAEAGPAMSEAPASVEPAPQQAQKPAPPQPKPVPQTAKAQPAEKPAAKPAAKSAAQTAFSLQLIALTERARIEPAKAAIMEDIGGILGDHGLTVEDAVVGGTTYFRILATGYPSRAAADSACAKIKASGQDCLVRAP